MVGIRIDDGRCRRHCLVHGGWHGRRRRVRWYDAHAYQGILGVVLTGVMGLVLGFAMWNSGSLIPVIVFHALIDLRTLALPTSVIESMLAEIQPAGGVRRVPRTSEG
ncbi:MAG: CPBP family intramembrane glutamic endopeptidase [Acidimicrobiales bacterium]